MYSTRPPSPISSNNWRENPATGSPALIIDIHGPGNVRIKTFNRDEVDKLIQFLQLDSSGEGSRYRVIVSLGPMEKEYVDILSTMYKLGPMFRAFQLSAHTGAESPKPPFGRDPQGNGKYQEKIWGPSWGTSSRPWFQQPPMMWIMHPPWRRGGVSPDGKEWTKSYSLFHVTRDPKSSDDNERPQYIAFCAFPDLLRVEEHTVARWISHSWERDLLTRFPSNTECIGESGADEDKLYLCPAVAGFLQFLQCPENFDTLIGDPYSPALYMLTCSSLGSQDVINHITPNISNFEEEDQYFGGGLMVYRAEVSHWLRSMLVHNILLLKQRFPICTAPTDIYPPGKQHNIDCDPLVQWSNLPAQLLESFNTELLQLDHLENYLLGRQDLYKTRNHNRETRQKELVAQHRNLEEVADRKRARLLQDQNLEVARLNIKQARSALEETRSVTLLTRLAFFYIPLTFVTSIFGMNLKELSGEGVELPVWVFVVTAVVIGGITYAILGAVYFWQNRQMKAEAEELEKAAQEAAKMVPPEPVVERPILWRSGKRWDPSHVRGIGGSVYQYPPLRSDGTPTVYQQNLASRRHNMSPYGTSTA